MNEKTMHRFTRLAALGLALSAVFLCVSCSSSGEQSQGSASNGPVNMICSSDPSQQVVRLSGVFVVKTPDPSEPWSAEFRRYLGQSGNEGGVEVTCTAVSSKDPQGALKDKADSLRKQNKQVVETGWTY